jgi:hypothetical protein
MTENDKRDLESLLEQLKKEAYESAVKAAGAAQADRAMAMVRAAKDCEGALDSLQRLWQEAERIRGLLDDAERYPAPFLCSLVPESLSSRARAQKRRAEWLEQLRRDGIHLRQTSEKTFETTGHKNVGVPFATERPGQPDLWWLGLADQRFDFVVLLCADGSGTLLDFILPSGFLASVWNQLSRDGKGQVKFHVLRNGPNFELRLRGAVLKQINQFLGSTAALKAV